MDDEKKTPIEEEEGLPDFVKKLMAEAEAEGGEIPNLLEQKDPFYWREHAPRIMRGEMKDAFRLGGNARKMKCTCWNKHCPYYGDCRRCIVFHMALKQIPTCQRDMLRELYLDGHLAYDLYLENEPVPTPKKD